jgi:hypothetical protein
MTRWEAGPCGRWRKMLMGELENNFRKSRDLVKNRHSDSLKKGQIAISQGKMKKGDLVADDEDDDVRTGVSPTLLTKELFLRARFIKFSPHIR